MKSGTTEALELLQALQRRLSYAEAITQCIAESLDTQVGDAIRGIALIMSDMGDRLDEVIADARRNAL